MLKRLNHQLSLVLFWTTAITCALFLGVILMNVLSRYVFEFSVMGSEELSRLFFLWSCFMAAALCFYKKAHIAITFITDRMPASFFKLAQIASNLVALLFFIVILIKSIQVVSILWTTNLPMLGVTQGFVYLPVPVAAFFMVLFALELLIDAIVLSPQKLKDRVVGTDH